jgi:hypothetical protein
VHTQNQNARLRFHTGQIAEHVQAAPPWHRNVEDYKIPIPVLDLLQDLLCVLGFSANGVPKFAHQDLSKPPAQDGMIVGDENADQF